jgi:hypothetical protein
MGDTRLLASHRLQQADCSAAANVSRGKACCDSRTNTETNARSTESRQVTAEQIADQTT